MKIQQHSALDLALLTVPPLASLGLLITGVYSWDWLAALGLVLLMTSLIVSVGIANSPTEAAAAPAAKFNERDFFPSGAVAFFASMIVFFGAIWFGLYALMVYRQGSL